MSSKNKVYLSGRLGKDPDIRVTQSGKKIANFSLATSEVYKNKSGEKVEDTTWHNCVAWSPLSEVIESYVKKGSKISLWGRLTNRSYEADGIKKYITEVVVEEFEMNDTKPQGNQGSTYRQDDAIEDLPI